MNSDQLTVERAAWAVTLKAAFKGVYTVKEHLNDYANIFVVTHAESPGWKVNVGICSAHNKRNRLEVDADVPLKHRVFANSVRGSTIRKLLDMLAKLRTHHDLISNKTKQKEATALQWTARQEAELAPLGLPDWVYADIITDGPNAGCYRVVFEQGSPMEHLNLDQLEALEQFLKVCDHTLKGAAPKTGSSAR